jgi:hypothetical protein
MPVGVQWFSVKFFPSHRWNSRVLPGSFVARIHDHSCQVPSAACQIPKSTGCCFGSVSGPRSGSPAIVHHSPATRGTTGNFDAPAPCVSEKVRTAKQIPSCPLCIRLNDRCFNIEWIDSQLNSARIKKRQKWCQRRDLNPRPKAYESSALPLSYSGIGHAVISSTQTFLSNPIADLVCSEGPFKNKNLRLPVEQHWL